MAWNTKLFWVRLGEVALIITWPEQWCRFRETDLTSKQQPCSRGKQSARRANVIFVCLFFTNSTCSSFSLLCTLVCTFCCFSFLVIGASNMEVKRINSRGAPLFFWGSLLEELYTSSTNRLSKKIKVPPDEESHGLSIQRKTTRLKFHPFWVRQPRH